MEKEKKLVFIILYSYLSCFFFFWKISKLQKLKKFTFLMVIAVVAVALGAVLPPQN